MPTHYQSKHLDLTKLWTTSSEAVLPIFAVALNAREWRRPSTWLTKYSYILALIALVLTSGQWPVIAGQMSLDLWPINPFKMAPVTVSYVPPRSYTYHYHDSRQSFYQKGVQCVSCPPVVATAVLSRGLLLMAFSVRLRNHNVSCVHEYNYINSYVVITWSSKYQTVTT